MHSEAEWSKKRSSCYFGTGCDSQKSMPASAKLLMHAFRKLVILLGFWVLTIWVWSAGLSAAPLEFNLAPNPSFEHGGPRNRLLYKRTVDVFDWIPYWEVGEYFWAERGRTGKRSLGISRTVKEDGTWAQGGWVNDYHFPAFDGVWYQFSAWVKTTKAQGHTHLVIAWFGPKGWIKNTDNGFFLAGTCDWVQISVADIPPKGASYGRIYLRSDANPGEALFDDVKLTLANDTEAPIIVPNSSFEVVAEGMPSAWEIWPPTVRSGVGENPQLSRTGRCFAYITDATQRASWQSQPFYLDACWTYTYEASVYANMDEAQSGQVRIGIEWLSSDRVISVSMSEPVQAGHKGWVKLLCKAEPPTGALRGRILLLAEWVKGTVRFDDVTLTIRKANAQREETSAERKLPLSVMIAQCYTTLSRYLAPDRLKERWETTFPDQGTVAALTREIEDYIKTNKEVDNELRRFLGMAHYHLGNYKTSLDYLRPLYRAYDNLDVLNDAVRHYMKWAEIGLGGKEIEAGIPNVVQPSEMKGVGGKDKTMAVIYMNDDEQTGGDWVGRYGRYAYHLCSMRQYHIVGGLGWPLSIRLYTTNPAEMGRRCIIQMDTDDTIALFNPHSRRRSIAYLDDRGEVYVGAGPDIICELVVPSGFFIISFYAREHRITALDEKGAVLDEAPRRKDHRNAYRRFFCAWTAKGSVLAS